MHKTWDVYLAKHQEQRKTCFVTVVKIHKAFKLLFTPTQFWNHKISVCSMLCLSIVLNRLLLGMVVTKLIYSVEYKVHKKNKCIEMNHLWVRVIPVTHSTCFKQNAHGLFSKNTALHWQAHRISITAIRKTFTDFFFPPVISPTERRAFWCRLL